MHYTVRIPFSGMLRRVALVRTNVPEEPSPSIIRLTIIVELGTSLACRLLVTANVVPSSPNLVILIMKVIRPSETSVITGSYLKEK
jgi:hypothetical protein